MNERKWIDIGPEESSFSAYEISKKVINLLRHSQTVQREDDGAVQFWEIKNVLGESISTSTFLVRRSLESMLGSRRRIKKKKSVLF